MCVCIKQKVQHILSTFFMCPVLSQFPQQSGITFTRGKNRIFFPLFVYACMCICVRVLVVPQE